MGLYDEELSFAVTVVSRTGAILKRHFRRATQIYLGQDAALASPVKMSAHKYISGMITQKYPEDKQLGEETVDMTQRLPKLEGRCWVWDGLDGARLYCDGIPWAMIALALVEDGKPLLGVIHDPFTDATFMGAVGQKVAYINGEPLRLSQQTHSSRPRLVLPGSANSLVDRAGFFTAAINRGADVLMSGAAVNDATLVLRGGASAFFYAHRSPWDIAAVVPIAENMGAQVTDLRGATPRYDQRLRGAIVSNGDSHEEHVSLVRPYLLFKP